MNKERCGYAVFPEPESTGKNEMQKYQEKRAFLGKCLGEMEKEAKTHDIGEHMLSVSTMYNSQYNLTACMYRQKIFLGVQDRETKQISFMDRSRGLAQVPDISIEKLSLRMHNALQTYVNKSLDNEMVKGMNAQWKEKLPELDKINAYETEFEKKSPVQQRIYRESGLYQQDIGQILEERELEPLEEDKLEYMYGADVGHPGRRDREFFTSSLEEDIAEKHYGKDLGHAGHVDSDYISVTQRFQEAMAVAEKSRDFAETKTAEKCVVQEDMELTRYGN